MSDFRDQFEQAREDYQSARYPGDLAADLLARSRTRSRPNWRLGIAFAAAASVAVAVGVWHANLKTDTIGGGPQISHVPPANIASPTDAIADATADDSLVAPLPASEPMPDSQSTFPTELPTMPTGDSASAIPSFPSAPSMPSFDSTDTTTSSEREPT